MSEGRGEGKGFRPERDRKGYGGDAIESVEGGGRVLSRRWVDVSGCFLRDGEGGKGWGAVGKKRRGGGRGGAVRAVVKITSADGHGPDRAETEL